MKIGLLVNDIDEVTKSFLKIIDKFINRNELEIVLLMLEHDAVHDCFYNVNNALGVQILKFQSNLEHIIFNSQKALEDELILKKLETIKVVEIRKDAKLTIDDLNTIKSYQLDLIIKMTKGSLSKTFFNLAKFGIWSLCYQGEEIFNFKIVGFTEILNKTESVEITLEQLSIDEKTRLIIDKAKFNYDWSILQTHQSIVESSLTILCKNIVLLNREGKTPQMLQVKNDLASVKKYNLEDVLKYLYIFYTKVFRIIYKKFKYKIWGDRYYCFTLFIGDGYFHEANLNSLKPVKLPRDEFWADPFIFKYKDQEYVFFENYEYSKKKGKLSCGKIQGNQLTNIKDVLDLKYHLSYPYIFEEDEEIFLMPETNENDRLEIYKCVNFPNEWVLFSTAFEGEKVFDASFYVDDNQQRWLFINKQSNLKARMDSELYIYRVKDLNLKEMEPHQQNPVVIGSDTARNGGAVFKYRDKLYRPSQANIQGMYGRALNINLIKKLSLEEYEEETVKRIFPNFHKGLVATHHLHQYENKFVIDAAYKFKR